MAIITVSRNIAAAFVAANRGADMDAFCDSARADIAGFMGATVIGGNPDQAAFLFNSGQTTTAQAAAVALDAAPAAYMAQMGAAMFAFSATCYGASWQHKAAVQALTTAAAVRAYDFSGGWPDRG